MTRNFQLWNKPFPKCLEPPDQNKARYTSFHLTFLACQSNSVFCHPRPPRSHLKNSQDSSNRVAGTQEGICKVMFYKACTKTCLIQPKNEYPTSNYMLYNNHLCVSFMGDLLKIYAI